MRCLDCGVLPDQGVDVCPQWGAFKGTALGSGLTAAFSVTSSDFHRLALLVAMSKTQVIFGIIIPGGISSRVVGRSRKTILQAIPLSPWMGYNKDACKLVLRWDVCAW